MYISTCLWPQVLLGNEKQVPPCLQCNCNVGYLLVAGEASSKRRVGLQVLVHRWIPLFP
ncbi:hypothetical protein BDV28DRAFT_135150 [Aspergillus coremiiformis]|uniref:Uncharacterized protein n=1 Tax=Aspergillus coremiiformis TaxID=138285 RepID=A0A5N6Z438_9EURO|nr:hypothetical protein BDV28DRAFT_135150 [Aspergillus coremiiformis]